ncbi:Bardet-Biedl syndrome 5 protein [Neocallimastix californiae]|jgi:Bardet-Biedl syndrome 5 protein|uniref:Bardet-Biedl syndrome 5 protein n=1 Tax=Neocallimastix californiae TaxID=1754190 RepID=A0A1Y2BRE9_9FUNG|nr:Bardet-Biedl syndrome 5 protein [Neocallimastix californiae]|eukprot:ORY37304.1 Bardet-Biedl syndrome 5 protein [Neocallimastix californiae]
MSISTSINQIWQDNEVCFDISKSALQLCPGEIIFDHFNNIEDIKGSKGESGTITITNLRVIWFSEKNIRRNISIGQNCIFTVSSRSAQSKLMGSTQSLYLFAAYHQTRYEFIFTYPHKPELGKLFITVKSVHKAYSTSRIYREIKIRGALLNGSELDLLPEEEIKEKINGVCNLSNNIGNIGIMYITNIRCVWHAINNESFNISIPYIQISEVKLKNTQYGNALVLQTFSRTGGYLLGFRIDPLELLKKSAKEIKSYWRIANQKPNFGIISLEGNEEYPDLMKTNGQEYTKPKPPIFVLPEIENQNIIINDDFEVDLQKDEYATIENRSNGDCYTEVSSILKVNDDAIAWDPDLGLAIEKLSEGKNAFGLWKLI